MPLIQRFMTSSFLVGELPMLSILAPRVFKPWPNCYRSCTGQRAASSQKTIVHDSEVKIRRPMTGMGGKLPDNGQQRNRNPYNNESEDRQHPKSRSMSTRTNSGETYAGEDRFREAYEDIWGTKLAINRFSGKGSAVREDIEAIVSTESMESGQARDHRSGKKTISANKTLKKSSPFQVLRLGSDGLNGRRRLCRNGVIEHGKTRPLRPRTIRLAFGGSWRPDLFSSLWVYEFTRLNSKYDDRIGSDRNTQRSSPIRSVITGTRSFNTALYNASVQEIEEAWEALPRTRREKSWITIMLYALESSPEWAYKFLIATAQKMDAPSYSISDSLEYLVNHYLREIEGPDARTVTILFRTVVGFLAHFDPHYLQLTQRTIFLLLSHSNIIQVERLYWTLVQRKHFIHENTFLQFAHTFAQNRRTQLAVDVLRKFREDGGDFAQSKVESVCSALLQLENRDNSEHVISDSKIFSQLLDLGLRPNIVIYNILIKNAVDSHDSGTAWQMHDILPKLGISADANTYSILLNDAKMRQDRPAMKRVVDIVQSKTISNEYIVTDILHAMFLIHEQECREANNQNPPPAPLKEMLQLYAEYFNLEPLRELLPPGHSGVMPQSNRPKMHPSRETLVVMLIALLRGFTEPGDIPRWYRHFRTLLLNGHPDTVHLAESTHIYDAVIMCLGRWPTTLHLCTEVVGDMLSSYSAAQKTPKANYATESGNASQVAAAQPRNPTVENLQERDSGVRNQALSLNSEKQRMTTGGKPSEPTDVTSSDGSRSEHIVIHGHCKPSVRTWSILLKAFVDNNQPRAAEKVFNMMRRAGIKPNQVTWNSLAIGYARLQDITNAVDVIERLEDEGCCIDEITIKGLQAIEDREAFMDALREKARRQKRRNIKQFEPLDSIGQSINLSEPGGLDDVIERGQRAGTDADNSPEPLLTSETSKAPVHWQPLTLHLHEDELRFIEMTYSTEQTAADVPADLSSMQAQPGTENGSDEGNIPKKAA